MRDYKPGMNKRQKKELAVMAGKNIRFDSPMAQYTTFRVGGLVDAVYEAGELKELSLVVAFLSKENIPYLIVGGGSNLLVGDDGLEGMAILLRGPLAAIEQEREDASTILAGAGLPIADLLIRCRILGLGGIEFLAGIPGTVGGAVVMNAGAFGKEIGANVIKTEVITHSGDIVEQDKAQLIFSYRGLEMEKGDVVVRACLELKKESGEIVSKRISDYLKRRKKSQPLEYPSAGSVFKNPQGHYAGRLIEDAGLKGKRIGGAMISDKHANFIINLGRAKARDILDLLLLAQQEVSKKNGINLEPEIQVVGRNFCFDVM